MSKAELRPGDLGPRPGQVPPAVGEDRSLLRLGAVTIVLGLVLQVVMGLLHPSRADPNDSAAAFAEYARSDAWTAVHIGQFVGTLLIVIGVVALSRHLARQAGGAGAAAVVAGLAAVLVGAVFAVQMAVDGVALKGAVDTWVNAAEANRQAAFFAAEAVRWTEKGLSAFFQLLNRVAFLMVGLAMVLGRTFPRWLGWVGVIAGLGALPGSVVVAYTGFSPPAALVLQPAAVLGAVFLVGTAVVMWREGRAMTTGRV
ncbi:hypothetical protein KZX45_05895 [Georgenia sp. EYE_87]|uniref:hypothetical protein n=1 Tax=Georgenia sp. EYE_87 TaxID=2853448 RepID=UPI002005BEFA|nr:hypothetical protein [Georgenia sp. EYE_87]MCK6210072.1 hypothetical protein [Georgenia sp. EYE_87]